MKQFLMNSVIFQFLCAITNYGRNDFLVVKLKSNRVLNILYLYLICYQCGHTVVEGVYFIWFYSSKTGLVCKHLDNILPPTKMKGF